MPPDKGGFVVSVEKTEKIVKESGMFFVSKKRPSTHHVLPRVSPRFHHKKTMFCTPLFPKHPLKTPAKTTKPRLAPGSHFFSENNSD